MCHKKINTGKAGLERRSVQERRALKEDWYRKGGPVQEDWYRKGGPVQEDQYRKGGPVKED